MASMEAGSLGMLQLRLVALSEHGQRTSLFFLLEKAKLERQSTDYHPRESAPRTSGP